MVQISIYFDTSSSMSSSIEDETRWEVAEKVWQRVQHRFANIPTKITTICSRRKSKVLGQLRSRTEEELAEIHIPEPHGMTFLWKFLVMEAKHLVKESDDWIFFLISDGLDNQSKGKFRGEQGIRPCIEEIEAMGIDAEFHIIGLGLSSQAEDIFQQLSGATGGYFENISSKDDIEDTIEHFNHALEDVFSPSSRAKKRLLRQREYLRQRKEGQLDLTLVNRTAIDPPEEGYLYGKVRVYRTNPERTQDWQRDLLSIQGHHSVEQIDEGNFWYQFQSYEDETDTSLQNSWSIDSEAFSQQSVFSPAPKRGIRRMFSKSPSQEKTKSKIDRIFELIRDIRESDLLPEQKQIVVRGDEIDDVYLDMLDETGARVVKYPRELPPPPPPSLDASQWEDESWFLENPTLDWTVFPHAHRQHMNAYAVIDPFVPSTYFEQEFSQLDLSSSIQAIHSLMGNSQLPFSNITLDEPWLDITKSGDEYEDSTSNELVEIMSKMLHISFIQITAHFLSSDSDKPRLVICRFSEEANKLNLHHHPAFLQFEEYCNSLNQWAREHQRNQIEFDFWV